MEASTEPVKLTSEITGLAQKYYELKAKDDELTKQQNDLDAELDMVRMEMLKKMEDLGLQNFKLEGLGTFFLKTSFYPKVLDAQKMIDWLDKQGASNIAPRTVHLTAFKEFYQERVEKDLPLPPSDYVDAASKTSVQLRRAK